MKGGLDLPCHPDKELGELREEPDVDPSPLSQLLAQGDQLWVVLQQGQFGAGVCFGISFSKERVGDKPLKQVFLRGVSLGLEGEATFRSPVVEKLADDLAHIRIGSAIAVVSALPGKLVQLEEGGSGSVVDRGRDRVWGQEGGEHPKVLRPGNSLVAPNDEIPLHEAVGLPLVEEEVFLVHGPGARCGSATRSPCGKGGRAGPRGPSSYLRHGSVSEDVGLPCDFASPFRSHQRGKGSSRSQCKVVSLPSRGGRVRQKGREVRVKASWPSSRIHVLSALLLRGTYRDSTNAW